MSAYYLPALIGLLSKIFILMYSVKGRNTSTTFISLVAVFACYNAIELVGYIRFLDQQAVDTLFRTYYVALICMLFIMTLHASSTSKVTNKTIASGAGIASALLAIAIVFTDKVVAGSYSIGYSITAVKGPYYSVVLLYILATVFVSFSVLVYGHKKAVNQTDSIRCLYSLAALAPLLIIFVAVVLFKVMGTAINAGGVVPIATTLFLFIMMKSEKKHHLTDIRRLLPFSLEHRTASEIMNLMDAYVQSNDRTNSFQELRRGLEGQAIRYSLAKSDDNITKAAKMMGLQNRSTLYSMMNRLEIDPSETK